MSLVRNCSFDFMAGDVITTVYMGQRFLWMLVLDPLGHT
jgi:hypothetical protein